MNGCASCRHWTFEEPDWEFEALQLGKCGAIQMRSSIIDAALTAAGLQSHHRYEPKGEAAAEKALLAAKAIAVDGSGYYAALRTTADFGCTLHEEKTT